MHDRRRKITKVKATQQACQQKANRQWLFTLGGTKASMNYDMT